MNKEELIILANKAKEIGIAISEWNENDFNHISIDTEGNIYANFSRYCWGEKDEEDIYIDEEDINSPIETTIVKYQKLAQEKEELAKAAKLANEHRAKMYKEETERKLYEELKAKYG